MESNGLPPPPTGVARKFSERVRLTSASADQACGVGLTADGTIQDLSLSGDAAIIPATDSPVLNVYGLDIHKGVLDIKVHPPQTSDDIPATCDDRSRGLNLVNPLPPKEVNPPPSPRSANLVDEFKNNPDNPTHSPPGQRSAAVLPYHWILDAQSTTALSPP